LASKQNGTIYFGVTSGLQGRAFQHREGLTEGFTRRYDCKLRVWCEWHETMERAIMREKQIKGCNRKAKLALIETGNPTWRDMFGEVAQ
jgi:putative endonuclease